VGPPCEKSKGVPIRENNDSWAPPRRKPAFLTKNTGNSHITWGSWRPPNPLKEPCLKSAETPGRGRCPTGIVWGEGSDGWEIEWNTAKPQVFQHFNEDSPLVTSHPQRSPWPAYSQLWLASAGCSGLRGRHGLHYWLHAFGLLLDEFRFLPRSVDLRLPSLQVDSPCLDRRGALDGLTVVATLVHELFSTFDCLEDPRRCAADSRRQCLFIRVGSLCLLHWQVLACCYPSHGKLHSLQVSFAGRTLWVWLVGSRALVEFPRGVVPLGLHHQGHLACAFGLGCGSRWRMEGPCLSHA